MITEKITAATDLGFALMQSDKPWVDKAGKLDKRFMKVIDLLTNGGTQSHRSNHKLIVENLDVHAVAEAIYKVFIDDEFHMPLGDTIVPGIEMKLFSSKNPMPHPPPDRHINEGEVPKPPKEVKLEDGQGFVFIDFLGKPYMVKMIDKLPWLFYWHEDNHWESSKIISQMSVQSFYNNITSAEIAETYNIMNAAYKR